MRTQSSQSDHLIEGCIFLDAESSSTGFKFFSSLPKEKTQTNGIHLNSMSEFHMQFLTDDCIQGFEFLQWVSRTLTNTAVPTISIRQVQLDCKPKVCPFQPPDSLQPQDGVYPGKRSDYLGGVHTWFGSSPLPLR